MFRRLPFALAAVLLLTAAATPTSASQPRAKAHRVAAPPLVAQPPALPATRCIDEDRTERAMPAEPAVQANQPSAPPSDPRSTLQDLVRTVLERSQAVGATQLLAEAAAFDLEEALTSKKPQVNLQVTGGPTQVVQDAVRTSSLLQLRATLGISQLLFDSGRSDRLADWRRALAESARLGELTVREQLALSAVSLALERSRYRQQVVVYGQYARKMGCLVDALELIVSADRGRSSELVQARKMLQQAEMLQVGAVAAARQVDVRLRRLVGDGLPSVVGMPTVLLQVNPLAELVADVERAADMEQVAAQAAAANAYAQAVDATGKPQVGLALTAGAGATAGGTLRQTRNTNVGVGLALTVPLYAPGQVYSSSAARKRAEAAQLQRADALESRRFRVAEVHDQVLSSFDRAQRVSQILKDSELLRGFTLQQWQQLGRRSLFDVMSTEADHYNLRVAYINALCDGQQLNANLLSLGRGVNEWLR